MRKKVTGFSRIDRVETLIQKELAQILQRNVKDLKLPHFITLSLVKITKDLRSAKIFFTVFDSNPKSTMTILNENTSFLRAELAKQINLRVIPQLHFIFDETLEYASRLSRVIDKANPKESE